MGKFIVIDGNSIANRAFYALPLLSNSNGLHTNAVYGFTTMLLRLIEEEKPTHLLVAFDAGKITFRHEGFKEYKGGRAKTPSELSEQFPLLKELLGALRIAQFELSGYEADDIIGTLSRMADEQKMEMVVVSGDKDMLQLASPHVTIALTRKGISEVERYAPEQIKEKYDLTPAQIIDLKGLMGDSSDNIPGIPGVGEKTALKLLHQYGSVEEVLAHADEVAGKMKDKIRDNAELARMSKELATIYREVPLEMQWDEFAYRGFDDPGAAVTMLRKLEFKSLIERLQQSGMLSGSPEGEADPAAEEAPEAELAYIAVSDDTLPDLLSDIAADRIESLHVEVAGDNPHVSEVAGLGLIAGAKGYYVSPGLLQSPAAEPLRAWLSAPDKPKVMYDTHKAEVALAWSGIPLRGASFDALLAAYLLDPTESDQTLHGLCRKFGVHGIAEDETIFGKGAKFHIPEEDVLGPHLCRKAAAVRRLAPSMRERLEQNGMNQLYYDLELPLAGVLASMELKGIRADSGELKQYGEELQVQLDALVKHIYSLAGGEFNLNSPKQLGEILFEKLGLPVVKKTKTGYSTDAEVLEKLEPYHPMIGELLKYRTLSKLQSTYVEGLLKEIRKDTGKVHTYYRQTIAATGRLSSQYPNLQNIPIRLEEGRKIRRIFIPSEPGWHILAADYSQIELRVLAHISGDERLKEAFVNDMDIHTKTAMDVFGVSAEQVDSNMRRQAKAVNFGIVYGISDYGLSQNLNITRKEAANFIEQYFAIFQGVRQYMDDIVKLARRDGYVTTLLERRRYLPDIAASNYNLRSFAERTAMNTPIQGTAADIIKLAMVQLAERLADERVKSRMLLQVHDELVLEVPEEELELMRKLLPEVMEHALALDVPLRADVSDGKNWYEAK